MRRLIALMAVTALVLVSCASDPTTSAEYEELADRLATTEQALADVTAERDELAGSDPNRYERSLATMETMEDILHNPESYGDEAEVIDLLASYATDDAVMEDAVLGAAPIRSAWFYTLYGGTMDSEIDIYHRWLSADGAEGVILWMWHGTNQAGNPFELAGMSLDTFDGNGLLSDEYVVYPYPDDYVREAVTGSGTARTSVP